MSRDKAEAVVAELEDVLGRDRKKERWIAFAINLGAGLLIFIAGLFFSDPILAFGNQLIDLLPWS